MEEELSRDTNYLKTSTQTALYLKLVLENFRIKKLEVHNTHTLQEFTLHVDASDELFTKNKQ